MLLEQVPDVIPLTSSEKSLFAELESTVETHLESFLIVGRSLAAIRSKRLYREHFVTFEDYTKTKWGLHRSRADELIRSFACAEMLLATTGDPDGDTPLPPNCPESVLRPVSQVPEPVQSITWELISRASPKDKPTRAVARQVCRMVRDAIGVKPHSNGKTPADHDCVMFLRPVQRLAVMDFDPQIACLHIETQEHAARIITACDLVIDRCRQIQGQLRRNFA